MERWISKMETATKVLPVIVGEFGSDLRGGAGLSGEQWVRRVLQALQDHGWNWTAWDLHPAAEPCLISDWNYTPTPHFGTLVKQGAVGTPTPTPAVAPAAESVGIFEGHGDVGTVRHPGSVHDEATARSYAVAGSGANMWAARDAFHYAWKKASGDLAPTADVGFPAAGTEPHPQGVPGDPPEPGRRLGLC